LNAQFYEQLDMVCLKLAERERKSCAAVCVVFGILFLPITMPQSGRHGLDAAVTAMRKTSEYRRQTDRQTNVRAQAKRQAREDRRRKS
jgi:hypothetical protein